MDFRWVTDDHLSAMIEAITTAKEPYRSKLRECLLAINVLHAHGQQQAIDGILSQTAAPVMTGGDVALVEAIVAKGVLHNGAVPTLNLAEVTRAVELVGGVLARIRAGQLSLEEQDLLEWIFDQVAEKHHAQQHYQIRNLEQRVRQGLGLQVRLAFTEGFPDVVS